MEIHYNDDITAYASFSEEIKEVPYINNTKCHSVEVVTSDKYIEENAIKSIDLIKIDTEGFEWEVLSGALDTIDN